MELHLEHRPDLGERLAAQHRVARLLLTADDLGQAASGFLGAIGDLLHWDVGALWDVPPERDRLKWTAGWGSGAVDEPRWFEFSRQLEFEPGVGLPGRAWQSGEIVWARSVRRETNFPRRNLAARLGLDGGFAIPVPIGPYAGVMGVFEFFTTAFEPPDEELTTLLVGFSDQLAMFVRRRTAEREVAAAEALKSAILGSALDCIVGMDHRGRIIEFNRAAERTFGYSRAEAVGRELAELMVPPELRARHRAALARYLEEGESRILDQRVELLGMRRDGTTLPVELTVTRIPGVDPPAFTGHIRDLTRRREAERVRARLAAAVRDTEDAVITKDLNGVITTWNEGAARLYGYTAEEAVGRGIGLTIPADRSDEELQILDRIRAGERLKTFETERVRRDGIRIHVSLTVSPITDRVLGIVGASMVARDITAEKRHREAHEFLARATRALDSSLDLETTMKTIVRTAVPDLGELCVIDLLDGDGSFAAAAVASVDPEAGAELERIRRSSPVDPDGNHPIVQVLRARRPMVFRDLTEPGTREQVAQSDEHAEFIERAGYSSAAVAPLVARGRVLGTLSVLHAASDRRYDPEDLDVLYDLAVRAALALDNARLYHDRDEIARVLQRELRPPEPGPIPGLDLRVAFDPAGEGIEVGGDFYDVLEVGDERLILVGDVAGKGSERAAMTARVRDTVRALALPGQDLVRIVERLNEVLVADVDHSPTTTAQLLRLRRVPPRGIDMEIVSAGHPPAIVVDGNGNRDLLGGGGLLGGWQSADLGTHRRTLVPGETLLLYTDGWLEAGPVESHRTPEELAGLLAAGATRPLADVIEDLRGDALERARGGTRDDLVLLALRAVG